MEVKGLAARRDGRREIFIGETRKVGAELVHENVICESVINRDRAIEIENSAAAIGAVVGENLDELVRRELSDFAQRAIVEREHVTLRTKRVVSRERVPIDAGRGTRNS